jgi:predicted Ser/Thr protein kinase
MRLATAADSDETRIAPGPPGMAVVAPVEVGRMLKGRFVLVEALGAGGMGRVFKAVDLRKQEAQDRSPFVALKVLNDDFGHHPEALKSLQREAKKAQALAHPNVVTVHDFDRDGAVIYMTMEYLPGQSLDRIVRARDFKGLPREEAFAILHDVGAALGYAHENGIIHLDLKPANILIAESGRAKVIDFGIARAVARPHAADDDATMFDAGVLNALTPTYASPEMLEGEEPDPRDDVYALACMTYELLAGHHPFGRMPATEARKAALRPAKPASLSKHQWRALQRGFAFERATRTPTVAAFVAGVTAKPWHRRHSLWLIVAGALAAGAAAASLVLEELPHPARVTDVPDNPAMSQVDSTAEMRARLSAAAAEAVDMAQSAARIRLAAALADARTAAAADADRRGLTVAAMRGAHIELAALRALLAEVDRQAAVAAVAAQSAAEIAADRKGAIDQAARMAGSADKEARATAAEEVARFTGALNEAKFLAAAEQAALEVAQAEAARQASRTVKALRTASEAARHY